MSLFDEVISFTCYAIESVGVVIIILGAVHGLTQALGDRGTDDRDAIFSRFRHDFAQSMMVGLEFLVAGDIIRTVIVDHSLTDIGGLGLLVLIRTVLVFTIHLEVEGRWPWQPAPPLVSAADDE
jgi:uncharacterized membrane protein